MHEDNVKKYPGLTLTSLCSDPNQKTGPCVDVTKYRANEYTSKFGYQY